MLGFLEALKQYATTHQLQVLFGTVAAFAVTRFVVRYLFPSTKEIEGSAPGNDQARSAPSMAKFPAHISAIPVIDSRLGIGSVSFSSLPPPSLEDRVLGLLLGKDRVPAVGLNLSFIFWEPCRS
jgi:hypothetical protein